MKFMDMQDKLVLDQGIRDVVMTNMDRGWCRPAPDEDMMMDEEYEPYLVWLESELRKLEVDSGVIIMVVDGQVQGQRGSEAELEETMLDMIEGGMVELIKYCPDPDNLPKWSLYNNMIKSGPVAIHCN